MCRGDTPNQGGQKSNDYQSSTATTSDKTNLSSPTTEFSKSKLSLEESKLKSSNEIMKEESKDNHPRNTEEKSTDEEVVHAQVNNVKDEALWDLLEVKMEPEEENVEEFNKDASIPKQKYNKLKKFEGKLFRFESKSSRNYKKIILKINNKKVESVRDVSPFINLSSKEIINFKEALIFGLLGLLRVLKINNCFSSITGARKNHCSGKIIK